ncbi:MAG: 23S rRNA (adenine(2503)-C(2))-methyltransferase RlmN [Spirochaetota bacterium]
MNIKKYTQELKGYWYNLTKILNGVTNNNMNNNIIQNKKPSILEYNLNELKEIMKENEFQSFRAEQIYNWIYKRGEINSYDNMANTPKKLRTFLNTNYSILAVNEVKRQESSNKEATKFLLELKDGKQIECVLLKSDEGRQTLCLSSQIGCALNCQFCSTAKMGFIRNLSAGEIISQFLFVLSISEKIDNIVFMGMGEPLLNYDNVKKAIEILNNKKGMNYGIKRITLSSSGIIKGIKQLIEDSLNIKLAVSLNSAIDSERKELMPVVSKSNSLKDLIDVLKLYQEKTGKRFTFEYVLIPEVNMKEENANEISKLYMELNFNLNLIPYNNINNISLSDNEKSTLNHNKHNPYSTPNNRDIERFISYFRNTGIEIVRRYRKGDDISAACGQLATTNKNDVS